MASREQLRKFYLTGEGLDDSAPQATLRPALLDKLQLPVFEHSYPLYFTETELPQPLFRWLQSMLGPILSEYAALIAGAFGELIAADECTAISIVSQLALATVRTRLAMLHVPATGVEEELSELGKGFNVRGWLIPFSPATPKLLVSAILPSVRRTERQAFAQELQEFEQRLGQLLAFENRRSLPLSASLGARASAFLNSPALAEVLRRRTRPTTPMEPDRRSRCESALATLQEALQELNRQSPIQVVPLADAGLCRRQMEHYVAIWKAMRIARLEVEGAFDPEFHSAALETFDWSMAQPHELAALPVTVVLATAQEFQQSLTVFVDLLQSGLPIKVLIATANPADDLGCLAIAYQDVFVLNSSVARVEHLIAGLAEMAQTLRPGVAVVSVGDSWTAAALLPLARACTLYRYQPDLGESWHDRFSFDSDRPAGVEPLTFAHIAALLPAFRSQFRIVPESAEPLDPAFPCLPVNGEDGELSQALYTRALAKTCSKLESRWRFLAELAASKSEKDANAGNECDPAAAERARLDGAKAAIQRVISILTKA